MDAIKHNPEVIWLTKVQGVYQLTAATVDDPATYRASVAVLNITNPGAGEKEIGYGLLDFIGTPYPIIDIGIDTIDVIDIFRTNMCPQVGQNGVIYKTVWSGRAPYLAPYYYQFLHPQAFQNSQKYVLDVLWNNDPNPRLLLCENTDHPEIRPFNASYVDINNITFNPYEDYIGVPDIKLMEYDDSGNIIERTEKPYFEITGGIVTAVQFGLLDSVKDWVIKISN